MKNGVYATYTQVETLSPSIQRVINAVQKRWNKGCLKPLSVDEMVLISCVSRSNFLRTFVKECSVTPNLFFEHQRLAFAALLLTKTNRNIEQIAEKLEYSSSFHFSKNFKKKFGLPPKTFRKDPGKLLENQSNFVFDQVFSILSATQVL